MIFSDIHFVENLKKRFLVKRGREKGYEFFGIFPDYFTAVVDKAFLSKWIEVTYFNILYKIPFNPKLLLPMFSLPPKSIILFLYLRNHLPNCAKLTWTINHENKQNRDFILQILFINLVQKIISRLGTSPYLIFNCFMNIVIVIRF